MKCPNCGNKLDDLEMRCMSCGMSFNEYDKTSRYKSYEERTIGIRFINVLQLICFIIIGIVSFAGEQVGKGFIYIIIGIITYFFIKGFSDIIDLLDSINNKMKE